MTLKNIGFILLLILSVSCGSPRGKMKAFGNLEVFYTKDVPFEYVAALGQYFEANSIVHPTEKHSVQLTSDTASFILKMILNPNLDSIPKNRLHELIYLERGLDTTVFKDVNFTIVITDPYFNPINTY